MSVPKFALEKASLLIGAGIVVLLLGEIQTRVPFVPHRLEYLPDRDITGLLQPNQIGFEWLANQSRRSALASVNSEGHRGSETDWSRPVMLALGSSEAFGMGVRDDEVWTSVLEDELRRRGHDWEVVNGAGLGFGAYHQAAVLERILRQHSPRGIVVSLSIGERYFEPIPEEFRDADHAASLRRQKIRRVTKFLPFLFTKAMAQERSIRRALRPSFSMTPPSPTYPQAASYGDAMAARDHVYWEAMIRAAEERNIFIFFVVRDPWAYDSSAVLFDTLTSLCEEYEGAYAMRMGPEAFGMEDVTPERRDTHYERTFTLVVDPHANAAQHALIGGTVADWIIPAVEASPANGDAEP